VLSGEVPSPLNPPSGCHFHPRCPSVMDRCRGEEPKLRQIDAVHVACHLYE
jgi:dipeptide transport system ATP-binding protein